MTWQIGMSNCLSYNLMRFHTNAWIRPLSEGEIQGTESDPNRDSLLWFTSRCPSTSLMHSQAGLPEANGLCGHCSPLAIRWWGMLGRGESLCLRLQLLPALCFLVSTMWAVFPQLCHPSLELVDYELKTWGPSQKYSLLPYLVGVEYCVSLMRKWLRHSLFYMVKMLLFYNARHYCLPYNIPIKSVMGPIIIIAKKWNEKLLDYCGSAAPGT